MKYQEERLIKPKSGFIGILLFVVTLLLSIAMFIIGSIGIDSEGSSLFVLLMILGVIIISFCWVILLGIKLLAPNEALVLQLFGKYYGTITEPGFYFVNPFSSAIKPTTRITNRAASSTEPSLSKKVSMKINSLDNGMQKVNDSLGNPLELSAIVFWRVVNPTKAVLNIDNYKSYLSSQTDSVIRNIARLYPYDFAESDSDGNTGLSLRSSSAEVAGQMKTELQEKVEDAGIEIVEVKLNQIAYAPEIAAAMLQRQQASAIIDARKKIVEGAVSMVQMALEDLSKKQIVELDDEKKAQMVCNLMVVLCGNKDAQPIVNSGSIY